MAHIRDLASGKLGLLRVFSAHGLCVLLESTPCCTAFCAVVICVLTGRTNQNASSLLALLVVEEHKRAHVMKRCERGCQAAVTLTLDIAAVSLT